MPRLQHRVLALAVALLTLAACSGDDGAATEDTLADIDGAALDTTRPDAADDDTIGADATADDDAEAQDTVAEDTTSDDTAPDDTAATDTAAADTADTPDTTQNDTSAPDTVAADTSPPACDYGPYGGPEASVATQPAAPLGTPTEGHYTCGDDHALWARVAVPSPTHGARP